MRTGLLDHYKSLGTPPPDAEAAARALGARLVSPHAGAWVVVQDFLDAYSRDFTPAGVLVVASDPGRAGGADTGIPFTDGEHARRELQLTSARTTRSAAAERFWRVVNRARADMGGPALEGLFAGVHLTYAFPFAAAGTADVPELVARSRELQRVTRAHLARVIGITRPQAIACVGRFAYEAVAACADNAHALAADLSLESWPSFVTGHAYGPGLTRYPKADYRTFRARLVPLDDADPALSAHADATLERLLADAWT